MKFLLTSFIIFFNSILMAGISRPSGLESTTVLPKNIRNATFRMMLLPTYDKFNNLGQEVGTGDAFNRIVTINDFIDGLDDEDDKVLLRSDLAAKGYNDLEASAGNTTGVVNVSAVASVPVLAVGVSKKFTLGVAVPYINADVKVDTGFVASGLLKEYSTTLESTKANKYDEARLKSNEAVIRKVESNGYEPLKSERIKGLGDMKIVGKYLLSSSEKISLSMTNILTLPTGEEKDINKLIDVPLGDGQIDAQLGFGLGYKLNRTFNAYLGTSYNYQFQDKVAERIPEKSDSKLTPDIDPNVERKLGNQFMAQFSLGMNLSDEFSLATGYSFQHKQADKFSGSKFSKIRYDWLADESEQTLSSLILAAKFSTVNLYKSGSFMVPMQLGLSYGMALAGKNTSKDNTTTFDLSLFF